MTMPDKKKVMQGLECCIDPHVPCHDCPYDNHGHCDPDDLRRDALILLREQEARVMTLEEVIASEEWMWVEYRSGYGGWQRQNYSCRINGSILWNDETMNEECEYGKIWMCWDKRPTDEQREAVKWDD